MKQQTLTRFFGPVSRVSPCLFLAALLTPLMALVLPKTVRASDNLVAWGWNDYGQANVQTLPTGLTYTDVGAGYYGALAVRSDGTGVGWGADWYGQENVPTLPAGVTYKQFAIYYATSLALRSDGQVVAFGCNCWGEGNVAALPDGVTYTGVAATWYNGLALRSDGQVVGWGPNWYGELNVPALPAGVTYTQLSAAGYGGAALMSNGDVASWGPNWWGETSVPALPVGVTYTQVAAGETHRLALRSDGTVAAWGDNGNGQCNVPALPTQVTYTQVAAGSSWSMALRTDGKIVAWGHNGYGQLNVPDPGAGSVYTKIAAGSYTAFAIKKDLVIVTLNGEAEMSVLLGGTFTDPGATAQDDLGNSLAVTTTGTVNVNALGTYYLTYTATDSGGRVGSATRTVNIVKKLPSDLWVAAMPSYTRSQTYANAAIDEPIMVWGRAWNGTPPYSYDLDFGDGSTHVTGSGVSAASATFIGATHTYSSGGSKTASLTVTDAANRTYTRQTVIRVLLSPTHDDRVNMAIEKGLINLYQTQTALDQKRIYWDVYGWNHDYSVAATGAPLMAFEENGHLAKYDYEDEIYAETVQKGLDYLLDHGKGGLYALSPHSDGIAVRDSDSNGDGVGAFLTPHTYANAFGAMALIIAHSSAQEAQSDIIGGSGPFKGMSYYDLVTDIIDQYSYAQGDGGNRGGWVYYFNTPDNGRYDGSAQQWPALTFKAAIDRWGLSPQQWVIDNAVFGYKTLQDGTGGAGYAGCCSWRNTAKTGGMLVGYSVAGKLVGDTDADLGRTFLGNIWNNAPNTGADMAGWAGEFYAMYGAKKGLQLQGVTTVSTPSGVRDWYQDESAWLLGNASLLDVNFNTGYRSSGYGYGQNSDGSWNNSGWIPNGPLSTAHAILILTKSVTVALPVPVIAPVGDQSARNPAPFTLDGTGSYHLDPNNAIVEWLWILDAGANPDWNSPTASGQTASVNPGWNSPGVHTATLRVKDNQNPANYATAKININVTLNDVPPVAVPIPPSYVPPIYTGNIGDTIILDGTFSYDVDGDPIVSYAWDLDGNGTYGTAADIALDTSGNNAVGSTASVIYNTAYNGQIGLKVCSQPRDINGNPVGNPVCSANQTTVDVYSSPNDLYVSSLAAANLNPTVSADISATLSSAAGSAAFNNVLVRFYNGDPLAGGVQLGGNYLVNIPAGGSVVLNVPGLVLNGAPLLWAFVDANNAVPEYNEVNNTANVNVANQPPTASLPAVGPIACNNTLTLTATLNDPDNDPLTVIWTVDGVVFATHNLPAGTSSDSISSTFGFGTHTVAISVTDGKSGPVTASTTFTIEDSEKPIITCPTDIAQSTDAGKCEAAVTVGTATATDNCGATVAGVRSDAKPLSAPYPKGVTTITWTGTDAAGNSVSCVQTVTVKDTENPVITCPAGITQDTDLGKCEATVAVGTATATDNCGATVSGVRSDALALSAPYPKGVTTITWTATDAAGNSASCVQTITVNDNEKPVITCPADIAQSTDAGKCEAAVMVGMATAADNCGATVAGVRSDAKPLSDPYPTGVTTIIWTATDAAGNRVSCTQTITVNDTEEPVITCPADIVQSTDAGKCEAAVTVGMATAADNCGATVAGVRSDAMPLSDPYPKGVTTITWTATDDAGNSVSCTQTITVNDTEKPTIVCPANILVVSDSGSCNATAVTLGTPTLVDNCPGATAANDHPSAVYPLGLTVVTWTVTDASGNTATCTQNVTVLGSIHPTLSGFRPPLAGQPVGNKIRKGQSVPHKLQLADCSGQPITSGVTVLLRVQGIDLATGNVFQDVIEDALGVGTDGTLTSDGIMQLTDGQYHFNLDTSNFGDPNTIAGTRYYRSTAIVIDNATLTVLGTVTVNLETSLR